MTSLLKYSHTSLFCTAIIRTGVHLVLTAVTISLRDTSPVSSTTVIIWRRGRDQWKGRITLNVVGFKPHKMFTVSEGT